MPSEKALTTVFPKLNERSGRDPIAPYLQFFRVKSMRYTADRKQILVAVLCSRLVDLQIERKVEKAVQDLYFPEGMPEIRLETVFELPENYGLFEIVSEYRESLIRLVTDGQPASIPVFAASTWKALSEEELEITVTKSILTAGRKEEWAKTLHAFFLNRFRRDVRVHFAETAAKKQIHVTEEEFRSALQTSSAEKTPENNVLPFAENAVLNPSNPGDPAAAERESAPAEIASAASDLTEGHPSDSEEAGKPALRKGKGKRGSVRKPVLIPDEAHPNLIYGKPFDGEIRPIADLLPEGEPSAVLHGEVFLSEAVPMKNNEKTILSFAITDYTDSIRAKLFLDNSDADTFKKELACGTFIKLKGRVEYDPFEKETAIRNIIGIEKIPAFSPNARLDTAPVKRVELHCHTRMSEADAIPTAKELVNAAAAFGHPALAITDHGCVYAFPEANIAAREVNEKRKAASDASFVPFKVIYGMEGYLVDDTREFVVNPQNRKIKDTLVVFDLETTGLSPTENRIIEIGAVKIVNGSITERFSTFVNPGVPIPLRIEMVTNISNEMVKDAPGIETVLEDFMKFIGDAVLVAHNAEFDVSFLKETAKRLGRPLQSSLSYLDTLGLSRVIFPKLSNYRLDTVAKELGIPLMNHHRAVHDAECTAEIMIAYLNRFAKKGLQTLQEVQQSFLYSDEAIRKLHSTHFVILVKNETGRVNLYKLCSESSLRYFHKRPLIPRTLLEKYREGLLIGSACSEGELFNAVLEGAAEEELSRLVRFYDYLEVQPVGNNEYLLRDTHNDLKDVEELREINRKIVSLGDLFRKPVCATGDAHFTNPEDAIYREILQAGKGFEDADKQPPLYLRTTDEMLKEFDYLGAEKAYEIVVTNTNRIAGEIDYVSPVRKDTCPPVIENSDESLRAACYQKAHDLYGDPLPKIVEDRLERELQSIIGHGYAVMYMIAEKLVSKSVSDGYLVGSRGSVGSSLAATMSGITEVNPLKPHYVCPACKYSEFDSPDVKAYEKYAGCDMPDKACPVCGTIMNKDGFNIPFETFLGFKGDKEPDIDLNFSGEYQSKAHAYTEVIFGKGQTFRAGTYGGIAEKTAYGYTMHFYEEQGIRKRSCEIERLSKKLVGIRRTTGQHPGGIVVLPFGEDINTFTPIQHPANDPTTPIITTSFEYHAIDKNLLKLDILGHDDPTMIRMLQELTGKDPTKFPLDSKEVMSLFESTEALGITPEDIRGCRLGALGIPEFGTDFAMNMVMACKPKHLSDLVRIAGMAHGTDVWSNNNQILFENGTVTLDTAICCRDDIMEYLIDMGLESSLAFNIMEKVRKGKGLTKEWETEMRAHGVPEWYIWSCNKIQYMFPKAHAAAYVMMAWRIAYCKVFYPLEYYCSYYTVRADGFNYEKMCMGEDRLIAYMEEFERLEAPSDKAKVEYRDMRIVQEMYARGFDFAPIDLETVKATEFQITADRKIMPALKSIEDLGESAADSIVEAVHDGKGPFTSQSNFRLRAKVSQTIVEKLVKLRILDGLPSDDQFSLFDSFQAGT